MKFKKAVLSLAIGAVAVFGVVSPANAFEVSQERSHVSVAPVAPVAHVALNPAVAAAVAEENRRNAARHAVEVSGGQLADRDATHRSEASGGNVAATGAVHASKASGGTLTAGNDCKTAVCHGKGSSPGDVIGGSTGAQHSAGSGGKLSAVPDLGTSHEVSYRGGTLTDAELVSVR